MGVPGERNFQVRTCSESFIAAFSVNAVCLYRLVYRMLKGALHYQDLESAASNRRKLGDPDQL